jgi:glycosidase
MGLRRVAGLQTLPRDSAATQQGGVDPRIRQTPEPEPETEGPSALGGYHHYRAMARLRNPEPIVAHGDFNMLLQDDGRIYAFTRRLGEVELLILGNFSAYVVTPVIDSSASWEDADVLLTNCPVPRDEHAYLELHERELGRHRPSCTAERSASKSSSDP